MGSTEEFTQSRKGRRAVLKKAEMEWLHLLDAKAVAIPAVRLDHRRTRTKLFRDGV